MRDMPEDREAMKESRRETIVAYIVLVILVSAMFLRAIINIVLFPERLRPWNYRAHSYVPAETYASTRPSSRSTNVPPQVPLPPPTNAPHSPPTEKGGGK